MFALSKNPNSMSSFLELAKNDKRTVACSPPGLKIQNHLEAVNDFVYQQYRLYLPKIAQ